MICSLPIEPPPPSAGNEDKVFRFSIVSATDEPSVSSTGSVRNGANQALTGGKQVTRIYSKFPHYIPLAFIALFMNPFLGLPAFLCALRCRHFQRTGQEGRAPKFSAWAFGLSLVAIASSFIVILVMVLYLVVFTPNIITKIPGLFGDSHYLASFNSSNPLHDLDILANLTHPHSAQVIV